MNRHFSVPKETMSVSKKRKLTDNNRNHKPIFESETRSMKTITQRSRLTLRPGRPAGSAKIIIMFVTYGKLPFARRVGIGRRGTNEH